MFEMCPCILNRGTRTNVSVHSCGPPYTMEQFHASRNVCDRRILESLHI